MVRNVLPFGNGKVLISYGEKDNTIEKDKSMNISVVIASAVTAYSRIHMSNFKNLDNITLYYIDTDSVDFDKPLSEDLIGKQLGKLKLENVFKEVVYLAPKVYGGIIIKTEKDKEYVRVKGLKNPLTYKELLPLLNKDYKISVKNEKWYMNLGDANIIVKDDIYTLMATENKRKFIYDCNNKIVATKALIINEIDKSLIKYYPSMSLVRYYRLMNLVIYYPISKSYTKSLIVNGLIIEQSSV